MKIRGGMHARLTMAALTRRPGMVALAVVAVAIGASVAAALLHVSSDVTRKLTSELRVLGPNLVLLPDETSGKLLDEAEVRARLEALQVRGVPTLDQTVRVGTAAIRVSGVGSGFAALHPSWHWTWADPAGRPDDGDSGERGIAAGAGWIGARLARRLDVGPGDSIAIRSADGSRSRSTRVAAIVESGTREDEALLIPLADAQELTARPGQASSVEIRVEGDAARAQQIATALESGGGVTARVRYALSRTEGDLLERMRRLMTLVTLAALVSAGLCAFGTLTDLALERRREIALLKALGATPLEIVRQFGFESLAIGIVGGLVGWLIGAFFAQVIGRTVFESAIALRPDVPLLVLGLATLVAVIAGLGPIRLALGVDPARVLKGD